MVVIGSPTDSELRELKRAIHEKGLPGSYRRIVFHWKGGRRLATVFVSDKLVEAERGADGQWDLVVWTRAE